MTLKIARGALLALGLASCTSSLALAQNGYPAVPQRTYAPQTAAFERYYNDPQAPLLNSPVEVAPDLPAPMSPYEAAMQGAWSEGSGNCGGADAGCGTCYASCCQPMCNCWWGGANFLYMGRDKEDFQQLSFDDTDLVGSVLNTDTANMNWSGGAEVFLGRWFNCGAYGIEARYWGIYPENQGQTVYASGLAGNLNTVFDFQPLNIGANNVNDLYDAAQAHRVQRSWQFHNVELNMLQGYGFQGGWSCNRFDVGLLGGVRYLRFDEGFQYASADTSPVFGADPANEAYYDIDVENHLVGVQLGANANYYMGSRWRLRATPKMGVFNNHVNQMQRIYNVNGVAVVGSGNPLVGQAYDINTTKDDVSFLAEIDLGLDYRMSRRWTLNFGYRAVALTGVALATTQIPRNFADIPGAQDIDNDESLILHGGYVGATYLW